ncbi:hypothetical protein [uncultured Nocardioides sp.]|uniref:hypothetical protein n=1 Tax=uncultured Nocardioides sp. TaxID=198441 RepID=UPI002633D686|nr:hypothetical protein [uncultured Nocardioides sp.]
MSVDPADLVVRGGVGGLAATYADLRDLADAHDALGDRVRARGRAVLALTTEGDLLASAALSPVSFATAEAALTGAVWGTDGAYAAASHVEADAVAVRSVVALLAGADGTVASGVGMLAHGLGRAAAPGLVAVAAPIAAGLTLVHLGGRLGAVPPLVTAAARHPGLVEPVVVAVSGSVDVLTGRAPPVPGVLALPVAPDLLGSTGVLAGAYGPDGPPRVAHRGDLDGPVAPPRGVADLLDGLTVVHGLSDAPGGHGTVAVDTLVGADGSRRHVVHLPGTDDMGTPPWGQDDDVRDLATNLRLMAGEPTTYGAGVVEAMREAGVRPGEPVLLTGHSQGGMQAVALADDLAGSSYDVRQVVTAGSPTAQVPHLGEDVAVLSLENRGDVVPLLDGAPNPDTPQRVTVTFDAPVTHGDGDGDGDGATDPAERHRLGHYRDAAAAVDASMDPSLRTQVDRMREWGFLDAESAERRVFRITR